MVLQQGERQSLVLVSAALKYIVLALSGYMDEVLAEYKEAKLRVLFLVELLESFLEPAISASQNMMGSGESSYAFLNDEENICTIALHVIRAAVRKPSILPSLEQEWRLGSVPPSVLLSILDPHLPLPSEIDSCKSSLSDADKKALNPCSSAHDGSSLKSVSPDDGDKLADDSGKVVVVEEASLFFAPQELKNLALLNSHGKTCVNSVQTSGSDPNCEDVPVPGEDLRMRISKSSVLDSGLSSKYFSLHVNHAQLLDYDDCKSRASEFRRLALDLHSQHNINLESHNAAVDALILSAECYINPFFMKSVKQHSRLSNQVHIHATTRPRDNDILELKKALGKGSCNLETINLLEKKRDKVFVETLLEAAEMDQSYHQKVSGGEQCPYGVAGDKELGHFSDCEISSTDAITLLRRNQVLLCNFLIHQLKREQQSLHETLMQSLLFLLQSATKLVCSPEHVINIILDSAEHLNKCLTSFCHQYKEGILHLSPEKVYSVQRHWTVLQSLVIASSGGSSRLSNESIMNGFQYSNLIPPSIWVCKIPSFSSCAFPLVRYLGWMAISQHAKGYLKQRLFLTSDLSQLTSLLSIFTDDLAVLDCVGVSKKESLVEEMHMKQDSKMEIKDSWKRYQDHTFSVMYPDLSIFFPDMQKDFKAFRESILEAVGLQLRSLPSSAVPDILCWFSDLCLSPFQQKTEKNHYNHPPVKGYEVKNAKAVILFVLEAIISEHMEAIVPEMPRVVQVLGSLCRSSYCDVSFLGSVMRCLKPIISYSLRRLSNEEEHLNGDSCLNFESLCFDEFFTCIKQQHEEPDGLNKRVNIALIIFILASVFHDLSFERKREVIQSSVLWVNFPSLMPTTTFHDYLCSFQQLLQSCNEFLVETLRLLGLIPMPQSDDINLHPPGMRGSKSVSWFPDDFCYAHEAVGPETTESCEHIGSTVCNDVYRLSPDDIEGLSRDIERLISKLSSAIELSWSLHPQLSRSLSVWSAKCLMYSKCLSSVTPELSGEVACGNDTPVMCKSFDDFFSLWKISMEGLAENVALVLETNCWEVACTMIDCLFRFPEFCSLESVVGTVSSMIEKIMYNAPKISWRLQTDRWLSDLISRGTLVHEGGLCLIELVSKMLNHPEPEQRFAALMHLGRLFGLNVDGGWAVLASPSFDKLVTCDRVVSISESVLSHIVSDTWDQVSLMAAADASLHLRTLAMALLVHYIPFSEPAKLKTFLQTADTVFQGLANFTYPLDESLLAQLSLAILAGVCLYCPAEDMSLIPQNVWRHVETIGVSKSGRVGEFEKRICQALCKVNSGEDDTKTALREALSSCPSKKLDPEFGNTRESVLEVLTNLTSAQSYFDIFAEKFDQEVTELEEAELEMNILQKEVLQQGDYDGGNELPFPSNKKDRLQQIKDDIRSLEKSRLREEIIARRQKKLLLRRTRQKYLEDATLREAELLQELDRERTSEMEKEVERQRLLELERAKTNELRYNLELEKERQTQREIQRELEQVESGSRPPRRDFSSSSHSSRTRDRYRDRENGRTGGDSTVRATMTILPQDMPVNSSSLTTTPSVVLSGSRSFSGQPPTILQSRDRSDECSSSYEENFDGSKDSGDAGSTGDPELGSGFDGLSGGFGGSQRHGSRGSKSRQILERRERDGRREGKWERKH